LPIVNVYIDRGTRLETPLWWSEFFSEALSSWEVHWVSGKDILKGAPDHILFPGGSASVFARNLGKKRRKHIVEWVRNGGSYIGVCAGAYLASSEYHWSLHLLPLTIPDRHWRRGTKAVSIECIHEPLSSGTHQVLYANGPVFENWESVDVWAIFKSNLIAEGGTHKMRGTPAICHGTCGNGIVTLFSPHLEKTPDMRKDLANSLEYIAKIANQ